MWDWNEWKRPGNDEPVIIPNSAEARKAFRAYGYGHSHIVVTRELWNALAEGKQVAWTDGEYTTTIVRWDFV